MCHALAQAVRSHGGVPYAAGVRSKAANARTWRCGPGFLAEQDCAARKAAPEPTWQIACSCAICISAIHGGQTYSRRVRKHAIGPRDRGIAPNSVRGIRNGSMRCRFPPGGGPARCTAGAPVPSAADHRSVPPCGWVHRACRRQWWRPDPVRNRAGPRSTCRDGAAAASSTAACSPARRAGWRWR